MVENYGLIPFNMCDVLFDWSSFFF